MSPQQLFHSIDESQGITWTTQSQKKIKDIALLYENFEQVSFQKYLMSEDYYSLLCEQVMSSTTVAHSDFYIDGYHLFNKQEELILLQLMKVAKSVTIVLTHDLACQSSVFELPERTFKRLTALAEEAGLSYEVSVIEGNENSRFYKNKALAHLEQHFLQFPLVPSEEEGVHFFQAANRRIEVEEVAKRIYQLVHQQNYTYSDIAVYTAQIDDYADLIASIFPKFEVPTFLDYTESMLFHPMMTLLYHVFDVLLNGWRHEAMFTLIKTGLFMKVDQMTTTQSFYTAMQGYHRQLDN